MLEESSEAEELQSRKPGTPRRPLERSL